MVLFHYIIACTKCCKILTSVWPFCGYQALQGRCCAHVLGVNNIDTTVTPYDVILVVVLLTDSGLSPIVSS